MSTDDSEQQRRVDVKDPDLFLVTWASDMQLVIAAIDEADVVAKVVEFCKWNGLYEYHGHRAHIRDIVSHMHFDWMHEACDVGQEFTIDLGLQDYECPTCGRKYEGEDSYTDEERREAVITGYCCEWCKEDNSPHKAKDE